MIKLISLLNETRIVTPEESILNGDITVYHGTTWTIAQNAKRGELGPINVVESAINILVNIFGESREYAKNIVKKSLSIRRIDPPRLFLTPNKESAMAYAENCSPYGGESTVDVLGDYFAEKHIPYENIAGMIQTKEPALITITLPLHLLLTHPNWNSPAINRIRNIIRSNKKYFYQEKNWSMELFVDEKIPTKYIQRIDKV